MKFSKHVIHIGFYLSFGLAFSLGAMPSTALAAAEKADLYDVPAIQPVSHRRYFLKNELTGQLNYLASDPFVKYVGAGLTYTKHFSDFMGWEVFNANYVYALFAGITKDLVAGYGQQQSSFDYLQYYVTTNITVNPIYTKNLVFNSSTVYSQIEFVAGGGAAIFAYAHAQAVFDGGIILRYFLTPNSSLKLDFRVYVFPSLFTSSNVDLTMGYAISL